MKKLITILFLVLGASCLCAMKLPNGTTDKYVYFVAVDATDLKTRETGLSGFTVYYSINGAAATAMTTPTVNETDATNMPGVYELLIDEADMTTIDTAGDDNDELCLHITHASMAPVTRAIEIYRAKITEGQTVSASGGYANADTKLIEGADATDTINAQTDLALTDYDPPTNAEMNARTLLAANYATSSALTTHDTKLDTVDGIVDDILVDTAAYDSDAEYAGAIWNAAVASYGTAGTYGLWVEDILVDTSTTLNGLLVDLDDTIGTPANASIADDIAKVKMVVDGLNDISEAQVNAQVDAALVDINLDHLLFASVVGTDVADNSVFARLVSKSATADWDSFANSEDSLEALRDWGDSAWVTATGFSTHDAADVWAVTMENSKSYAQVMRVIAAVLTGKSSIGTGTMSFVGIDGTTTRLTVTVSSGARTSIDVWDGD